MTPHGQPPTTADDETAATADDELPGRAGDTPAPAADDSLPAGADDPAVAGEAQDPADDAPGVIDLLEPRAGLPPVISSPADLAEAIARLAAGAGPVAVDAERASGYRYGQRAYLVQVRRADAGTVLIDPIACPDLSGLDAALADVEAVLHAASQDLPCLAEVGYRPRTLFDTELAGRLLGYPKVALGAMLEDILGFRLAKEHSAADWSVRPLPTEMLRYAALDVEILIDLRDALAVQLAKEGKAEWARQEFAAIATAPLPAPRPDPWRRTSGIHRVRNRRALGAVRELWATRDAIAQDADLSPRRVLADTAIIEAARTLPTSRAQLERISGFTARNARRHAAEWLAAVQRARDLDDASLPEITGGGPNAGPPPPHRWGDRYPEAAARLAAARKVVTTLSDLHRVPAENLISPDAVRRLSWEPPDPADADAITGALAGYGARPWQAGLLAAPIAVTWRNLPPEPDPTLDPDPKLDHEPEPEGPAGPEG